MRSRLFWVDNGSNCCFAGSSPNRAIIDGRSFSEEKARRGANVGTLGFDSFRKFAMFCEVWISTGFTTSDAFFCLLSEIFDLFGNKAKSSGLLFSSDFSLYFA